MVNQNDGPNTDVALTTYIDGVLNHAHTKDELSDGDLDGRWGLAVGNPRVGPGKFSVFSDNGGGEEQPTAVSNLALFDTPLSAGGVATLGGAGSPIPEPNTIALVGLAALALAGMRKRMA